MEWERGQTGGERGRTRWKRGSDWAGTRVGLVGNGVELEREQGRTGGNGVGLMGNGVGLWGTGVGLAGRTRAVGLEYKRRGPAHLAPLFVSDAPRPPAST